LNGFNGKKLNYDQKLTKEEVFYLKSSKFKPSLLYSKCNDLTLSSIIQEVQNYIYPNDIQAIYPFQLEHSSLYGEENQEMDSLHQDQYKGNGLDYLDHDHLNQ
jgi:hypothetical protein